MTSIKSTTSVVNGYPISSKAKSSTDYLQDAFAKVLQEAGKQGWASADPLPVAADTKEEMVSSYRQVFEEISQLRFSYLVENQQATNQKELSLSELKDGYQNIIVRAYDTEGYSDPVAFVQTLSKGELAVVQKMSGLAEPIDATKLSSESALNLLLPFGAKVDENRDGLTSVGAAHGLGFPDSQTPRDVRDAWETATAGLDPAELGSRVLEVVSEIRFHNMYANPDGSIRRIVEPGDPDWINPYQDPSFSYKQLPDTKIAYYERFKNELTPEQYQSGKNFWTNFGRLLNVPSTDERGVAYSSHEVHFDNEESNKVNDIIRQYDVRSISHREIQSMGRKLYTVGAIDSEEYRDFVLSTLPVRGPSNTMQDTEDIKMDYMRVITDKYEYHKTARANDTSTLRVLEKAMRLYERFQQPSRI